MEALSSQADSAASFSVADDTTPTASGFVIEELTSSEIDADEDMWEDVDTGSGNGTAKPQSYGPIVPGLYTSWPPLSDLHDTETSYAQHDTVLEVLPFLSGTTDAWPRESYSKQGVPRLRRAEHIRFLHKSLGPLPAPYAASDAARPWFFYWSLCALRTLGEDISQYRDRMVSTVRPMQNSTGGFGGGHGQMSHLATTYAIVLSLAMVGGEEAYEIVDRRSMWRWLGSLKQADGGFRVAIGGEEDVRGAYCASVIISLLDLPLTLPSDSPGRKTETGTFFTGLPEWIGRCQTYEGGMSAFPGVEAHGAYAFCALACLSILGEPHVMIPKYLDIQALVSWLSARQYAPEGGFCGRTNKLVDGCYSFWVGGCWPLIAAALNPPGSTVDSPACLYDKEGLIRYILCACQDTSKRGGLRDKPSKNSDPYHTCYVLAGLSSAQHVQHLVPGSSETAEGAIPVAPKAAFRWFVDVSGDEAVKDLYEEDDKVGALHPVFVLPPGVAELMREYFEGKEGF